jgi:hypothetical protein
MFSLPPCQNAVMYHESARLTRTSCPCDPKLPRANRTSRFGGSRPRMDASCRRPRRSALRSDFDGIAGVLLFRYRDRDRTPEMVQQQADQRSQHSGSGPSVASEQSGCHCRDTLGRSRVSLPKQKCRQRTRFPTLEPFKYDNHKRTSHPLPRTLDTSFLPRRLAHLLRRRRRCLASSETLVVKRC